MELWSEVANTNKYAGYCKAYNFYDRAATFLVSLAPSTLHPTSILDLCCGTGVSTRVIAHAFSNSHVLGLDRSSTQIEAARCSNLLPNVEFLCGNLTHFPATPKFDAVFCSAAFWYLDSRATIQRLQGLVRDKGYLFFNTPPHFAERHISVLPCNAVFADVHEHLAGSKCGSDLRQQNIHTNKIKNNCDLDACYASEFSLQRIGAMDYTATVKEHIDWLKIPAIRQIYFPDLPEAQIDARIESMPPKLSERRSYLALIGYSWKLLVS